MAKKCDFWDVGCNLSNVVPALAPAIKALDGPYREVTKMAAGALKGTPLEGASQALQLMSVNQKQAAAAAAVKGALDIAKAAVPGLSSVPGLSQATAAVQGLINPGATLPAKKAGGIGDPKLAAAPLTLASFSSSLKSSVAQVGMAIPGQPPVIVPPQPAKPPQSVAVQSSVAQQQSLVPQSTARRVRVTPVYTQDQWIAHTRQADSVGGTQPL